MLSDSLCAAAEQRLGSHFGGLEQFISFLLEEALRDDAARMNEAELHVVEERLRDLGYM
jgi:hypothetical protein